MPTDARSAEVQKTLVDSASQFARHAIDAYLDGHYEVFLMHAATASEHLLKASLCGRSVALIAQAAREREHFRSLIALLAIDAPGQSGPAKRASGASSESIRTIGADEALRRVAHFVPTFKNGPVHDDLLALFAQRNGVVHLGEAAARNDALRLRLSFVAACEQLLVDIGVDASHFWWQHEDLAARWGEDARSETEQAVQDKVDAAKRRFQLTGNVVTPASAYDRLSLWHDEFTDAIVDCPVCGLPCHATGYPDTAPADLGEAVALFVEGLCCDVCGLHLNAGELQLAGAPLIVPLPNVTTGELDDFYATTTDSAEPS